MVQAGEQLTLRYTWPPPLSQTFYSYPSAEVAVNHTVGKREHMLLTRQLQITAWHLNASPVSKGVQGVG